MPSYYAEHAQQLKRDLAAELSAEDLRKLHQKKPWLHALIAILNVAAIVGSAVAIVQFDRWYLWLPFAFLAGFAIFDFTVLLHEVVHRAVLPASNDRAYRRSVDRVQALCRTGLLRLPDRLRPESPRPALSHQSR